MESKHEETQVNLTTFFGSIASFREELGELEDKKLELNDKIKKIKKDLEKVIKAGIQAAGY